jgi:hypothetical protein
LSSRAVAHKGSSQHAISRFLGFISVNRTITDTRHGNNGLSSPQFDCAAQVISCNSLSRVLLTFLNEQYLCPLDPEPALMIGEREMFCATA